jgi:hypothetical protein
MFAGAQKTVAIEDEKLGRIDVTIRKLSWKSLKKARQAKTIDGANELRAFGGEIVRAFTGAAKSDVEAALKAVDEIESRERAKKTPEQLRQERYDAHDPEVTLVAGVVGWTAEREFRASEVDNLDDQTAKTLHEEIVDYSLGPIDAEAHESKD